MRYVFLFACAGLLLSQIGTSGNIPSVRDGGPGESTRSPVASAGPLKEGFTRIIGARFLDVDGNIRHLGDEKGAGPAALVFVDNECPVSARYLGELNDFAAAVGAAGVDFYAVVSNPLRTWADARRLRDEFGLRMPVLFDQSGDLAARLGPVTLAEAFLINEHDRMIYRGRIDDRFAGIGKLRRTIGSHDLLDAFKAAHDPRVKARATPPVGCFFEAWRLTRSRLFSAP